VVVAAGGTPYASLVGGCTAEECHSRPGQVIVGPLGLGTTAGRDGGGAATTRHAAAAQVESPLAANAEPESDAESRIAAGTDTGRA